MAEIDLSGKTDQQLDNLIDNHERAGALSAPLYLAALEERDRRRGFSFEASMAAIRKAAAERRFLSYADLAAANGAKWSKVYRLVGPHLWDVVKRAHAQGLPLISAIVVNKENVATGALDETALRGFIAAARELGREATDEETFLREEQERVFEWGATLAEGEGGDAPPPEGESEGEAEGEDG